MTPETDYRMAPGLGAIKFRGELVAYQLAGDRIAWARPIGEPCMEITAELEAAIVADQGQRA